MKRLLLIFSFVCVLFSSAFGMNRNEPQVISEERLRIIKKDDFMEFGDVLDNITCENDVKIALGELVKAGAYRCICFFLVSFPVYYSGKDVLFGPMMLMAIENGYHKIVEIFLNQGVDVAFESDGKTCIEIGKKVILKRYEKFLAT